MSKRKWEEINGSEVAFKNHPNASSDFQRRQFEGLLEQCKRTLAQSLDFARYPERQKLSRRQKTAKAENSEADIARLNTEIAALKKLESAKVAELHLYRSLLKAKRIMSHPSFPDHVRTTVEAARKPLDTAYANVQARLFKSGPVQTAMTGILKNIRALLAIPESKEGKKKRLRASDFENGTMTETSRDMPAPKREEPPNETDSEWEGLSSSEHAQQSDGTRDSDDEEEEDNYNLYASRLAASSDSDSDSDSEPNPPPPPHRNPASTTEPNPQPSPPPKPKVPKKPPPTTTAPKTTTFLPSLSMGGYWSGSGSGSGTADQLSDTEPQARRNRRGQQARRALWEKKFGKNAKHLKNRPLDRDEGWDARRGASGGDGRGKRGRGRGGLGRERGERGGGGGRGRGRGPVSSGANRDPVGVGKMKPAAEGPLHPSWEAAKKAKEKKQTVAFQGKKVVFS